jgi:hypothetical protein
MQWKFLSIILDENDKGIKKLFLAFLFAILKFQIIYENADRNSISDFKRN